jgi:hypothetical protein
MYLPIRTWLVFLFLSIAAFAPLAGERPDWLIAYYVALFACWIVTAILAVYRLATDDRSTPAERMLRHLRSAAGARTDPADPQPGVRLRRRIIVAGDASESADQPEENPVVVITDRRRAERRRRTDPCTNDRRVSDRRRYDIRPLLSTQGWAEIPPLTPEEGPSSS